MILIKENDFTKGDNVVLRGRRFDQIKKVHRAEMGKTLSIGLLNDKIGTALVTSINETSVTMEVNLTDAAPAPLPLTLFMALPRPKATRRIIQTATTLGIKQIYFINSWKVEKSYWQSPILSPEGIDEQIILGLEQCRDTIPPEIHLKQLFKPFIEDEAPSLIENSRALLAHPYSSGSIENSSREELGKLTFSIGPEGGFTDYEIEKFIETGFETFSLGSRIFKVETALTYLTGKFFN